MNTAKILRSDIIEILFKTDDVKILKTIYAKLKVIDEVSEESSQPKFMEGVRQVISHISLEDIMKEQSYHPISYSVYRAKVDKIQWNESLEELLSALK